ncbi:TPA: hypothetical protein DCZ15_02355 [Candidatus Falkowbacteria bacterium]|nr:MAG: hypothetical protein UV95_C0001G0136 [Candidatus Falkowbacteria bacterium GW2011_GWF2_43_32]HBA36696.1 hypothetical protein [Candidatus Falkowbacteria bacterium]
MPRTTRTKVLVGTKNNIKSNITDPAETSVSRRASDNKTMRRDIVFPLIVGIVLGALVMIFWQFNARLNSQIAAVNQLSQATAQNSQTIGEVVTFINSATGQNAPAATEE